MKAFRQSSCKWYLYLAIIVTFVTNCSTPLKIVTISADTENEMIRFAAAELNEALKESNPVHIAAGLMYGGYAQTHVFSATSQPFHEKFVKDIEGMKTIWTLRNKNLS